jgi:hypothetical protein
MVCESTSMISSEVSVALFHAVWNSTIPARTPSCPR